MGPGMNAKETFDGTLLVYGQVVVENVLANDIILLDDVLPRLVAAAVG